MPLPFPLFLAIIVGVFCLFIWLWSRGRVSDDVEPPAPREPQEHVVLKARVRLVHPGPEKDPVLDPWREKFDGEFDRNFHSRVAGISHENPDGTSRQDLLCELEGYSRLFLVRQTDIPGHPETIAYHTSENKLLGYVPRETAEWLAPEIDRGEVWLAGLLSVAIASRRVPVSQRHLGARTFVFRLTAKGIELNDFDKYFQPDNFGAEPK